MKDKWGGLLDVVTLIMLSGAVLCATALVLTTLVLAFIIKPIKLFYKGMVFITNRSWNWLRAPLDYQGLVQTSAFLSGVFFVIITLCRAVKIRLVPLCGTVIENKVSPGKFNGKYKSSRKCIIIIEFLLTRYEVFCCLYSKQVFISHLLFFVSLVCPRFPQVFKLGHKLFRKTGL